MGDAAKGLADVEALRRYTEWRDAVIADCRSVLGSMSARALKQILGCSGRVAREAWAGRFPQFRALLRWLPALGAYCRLTMGADESSDVEAIARCAASRLGSVKTAGRDDSMISSARV
jgi:hypothetical protein